MRGFLSGSSGSKLNGGAKKNMLAQLRKGGATHETSKEKYDKMIKAKMNDLMEKAMTGGGNKFGMFGNKEEKKMSKTTEKFYQKMKEAKQQKEAQIEGQKVVVKNKSFNNGGRVDKDGKIYNKAGKLVGTVDLKNGDIKNTMGSNVGKYKEGFMTNNKISGMIDKSMPKGAGAVSSIFSTHANAPTQAQGPLNIWSTYDTKDDGNSWW